MSDFCPLCGDPREICEAYGRCYPPAAADIQFLRDHGWEISDDEREARLYSEEWSSIQVAVASTKWWVCENAALKAGKE